MIRSDLLPIHCVTMVTSILLLSACANGADSWLQAGASLIMEQPESAPAHGDCDGDGDVDLADFAEFQICFADESPGVTAGPCACGDFDEDGDVDLTDFADFQLAFSGPAPLTWQAPLATPMPSFGIEERAGNPTYYIDQNHPDATDVENPFGSYDLPRLTLPHPLNLQAGDVVEIAPGDYTHGSGVKIVQASGTPDLPVFIRGTDLINRPRFDKKLSIQSPSQYVIVENIDFDAVVTAYAGLEVLAPSHHVAVRHCEFHNREGTPVQISSYSAPETINNIVIFDCQIHDNGDWQADFDQDFHGIAVGHHADHIWIVDNEIWHNSGDGVQINAGNIDYLETTHHIYIARNHIHHNKQTGAWLKQCRDVVVSQNYVHDHRPVGAAPSAFGAGMGFQYGPENVWFVFNEIFNCDFGIQVVNTHEYGYGERSYFIGNLIHNIHHSPGYAYSPQNLYDSAGINIKGGVVRYIYNNTIDDVDAGINCPGGGTYYIRNNIIADVVQPLSHHVGMGTSAAATDSDMHNNLLAGDARVRWIGSSQHTLEEIEVLYPGVATGSIDAPPAFVDSASGDLHVSGESPAIDVGIDPGIAETFYDTFGLLIDTDFDGEIRPQGRGYDMGAFEYAE